MNPHQNTGHFTGDNLTRENHCFVINYSEKIAFLKTARESHFKNAPTAISSPTYQQLQAVREIH